MLSKKVSQSKLFGKLPYAALFVVALFGAVLVTSLSLAPSNTYAGGAVGDAGGAGGGSCSGVSNCPHTNNGYGWYKYDVNGAGPAAIRSGGSWANVQNTCRSVGAQSIIAFIILTPNQSPTSGWVYLYVPGDYTGYWHYYGNDGGNWLTFGQAQSAFYSLSASDRAGYSWGSNVAWFCYDYRHDWNINGQSYLQVASSSSVGANRNAAGGANYNATPGNRLYWFHDVRNTGPDAMDVSIAIYNDKSGFSNGWNGLSYVGSWAGANNAIWLLYPVGGNSSSYTIYDVQQADVGNTLCERIYWQQGSSSYGGPYASTARCASIPYNYGLTPTITNVTNGGTIEGAIGTYPVTGNVKNSSGTTKSHTNIQWQITQVVYNQGQAGYNSFTGSGVNANIPCTYFTGETSCSIVSSGTEAGGYGKGASVNYNGNGNIGNLAPGAHVCYAMSIKRNSSSSADWRHSQLYCVVVGKKPKVQVLGGDLLVGRQNAKGTIAANSAADVKTSVSKQSDGKYYGSYVEYAILPSGIVTGMASGSGYAGGVTTNVSSNYCAVSYLTFTNAGASTCGTTTTLGKYTQSSTVPDVAARFPTTTATPSVSGAIDLTGANLSGLYRSTATSLTITSSGAIPAGRSIIINAPNATVTIGGNIKYTTSTLHGTGDIPQVVIIANNILVSDAATQVDAWLIAQGTGTNGRLNTCGAGGVGETTALTSLVCRTQLVINGPIVANHLLLRRTAGAEAGNNAGVPGEVINLRADAYIWAATYSPGTGRLPTVRQTELPPRY